MITKLGRFRYLRIAGFALAGVVVAGVAVAVTASAAGFTFGFKSAASTQQSPSPKQSATSATVCADFMHNFAVRIGKSQAQINTSFQQAISDTLKDEVSNKQITQDQANQIQAKLANQTPCTLASAMPRGHHEKQGGAIAGYLHAYETAAAGALGITPAQLKTDLGNGQTLSQIAATQHVSEADFRTKLIANLKPALDAAVTNNQITSAQEQTIIKQLQTGELPLWSKPMPHQPGAAAGA